MGLILNKNSGKSTGLKPEELDAVHECLTWGRQPGNNKPLLFFGTVFETFYNACHQLMGRFKNVLPEGCLRARIRATRRESHHPKEGCLADTLGEETHGMVVVDGSGLPMKYDALNVMADVVATQTSRIELDVPGEGGRGWQGTRRVVDIATDDTLGPQWRNDISQGAQHFRDETYVSVCEPHYDAKVWPHVHPYGTGSVLAEPGAGSPARHARNRLVLIQSFFRRSAMWGFWFLNRLITAELYFTNKKRQAAGRSGASTGKEEDPITRQYGTVQPGSIPESTEWWKKHQKDLFAMSDDSELGLMQAMVTVTHNDSCPEMLAAIRRGPFATPTEEESIEYLLKRKPRDRARPAFEQHSLEHVLSFQRRGYNMKKKFMVRNKRTPLGRIMDWWDRTEAQMRAALHAHILCWFYRREPAADYNPLKFVDRTAPGTEPKQRPRDQVVPKLDKENYQEDNMYHHAEVGRIVTEMVRPYVDGENWGGFGWQQLRVAGLARIIQTRLYLHTCSTKYCLQNRSTCRFFFPWPEQPQQQYDANTERVACQRRCQEDDQWLNPHNLYLMMFSPSTIHVLPFDPRVGSDQARHYAGKYASKAEKWYYLETERNGLRNFLKCRTFGLCMAHNRLLGFHVVRSTRPVVWTPPAFIPERTSRTPRPDWHIDQKPDYPDPHFYLNATGKYFFRNAEMRHMRIEQFNRYFALAEERADAPTLEDTCCDQALAQQPDHKHYDAWSEAVTEASRFDSVMKHVEGARRRNQSRLAVSRTATIEPIGAQREKFYEQRLLLVLAWYCDTPPTSRTCDDGSVLADWAFKWNPPSGTALHPKVLVLGPDRAESFETLCAELEKEFCRGQHGLVCECCALEDDKDKCRSCLHCTGFHRCRKDLQERVRWRKGSLHGGDLDAQRAIYNLHRRRLPIDVLRDKAQEYVTGGLLAKRKADNLMRVIEQERDVIRSVNDADSDAEPTEERDSVSRRLSMAEMKKELEEREAAMKAGGAAVTDQWRVYTHIISALRVGEPLRLMVQASAGTGL